MAKKIVNVVYKVDDKELAKVKTDLKGIEDATKKSEKGVKELGTQINKVGKEGSQSFLNFKSIVGAISLTALIAGVVTLGKKIFELGVQQEQLNIAFTTFLGSAEKAKKLLAELTKFSIVTPFTPEQVNKAAKTLLAFGVQAKDIIPTLKLIGDVSAGTGKDLAEMAVIFGQIRSTGRLMGQDLLQLINAGFNPLQVISEKTGKSVVKLKSEMENGLITFDMVKQAFIDATSAGGLFFNTMENQSISVGGKLSTFAGNLEEVGKALFKQTQGPLKEFVDLLVKASEAMLKIAKGPAVAFEEAQQAIIEKHKASGRTLKENIDLSEMQIKKFFESRDATKDLTDVEKDRLAFLYLSLSALENFNEEADKDKDKKIVQKGIIEELTEKIKRLNEEIAPTTSVQRLGEINAEVKRLGVTLKAFQGFTGIGPVVEKSIEEIEKELGVDPQTLHDTKIENQVKFDKEMKDLIDEQNKEDVKKLKEKYDVEQSIETDAANLALKELEKTEERKRKLKQETLEVGLFALGSLLSASLISQDEESQELDRRHEAEMEALGNNENAKKQLRIKQEKESEKLRIQEKAKRKQDAITQIGIDTAINVIRSIVNGGGIPFGLPFGALAAAAGLIQIATVQAFKKGEVNIDGPGTTTSDSIPAMLSRGESVINADATRGSQNLLEAINDRKIDDRILGKIAGDGGRQAGIFDDSRIVKELIRSRVKFATEGHTLYSYEQQTENYRLKRRAKI